MSCCGQTAEAAVAAAQGVLARRVAGGGFVQLVYTGGQTRVTPFVALGKVYQFGNVDGKRVRTVPVRAAEQLLQQGLFAPWDAAHFDEQGRALAAEGQAPTPAADQTSMNSAAAPVAGEERRGGRRR